MKTTLSVALRKNLTEAIHRHPDSFKTICVKAGYSTSYVRRVLKGEKHNPTLYFVECLAEAVGEDPLKLLGADSEQA